MEVLAVKPPQASHNLQCKCHSSGHGGLSALQPMGSVCREKNPTRLQTELSTGTDFTVLSAHSYCPLLQSFPAITHCFTQCK